MSAKLKDYTGYTQGGYPCTDEGYSQIEVAEKLKAKDIEFIVSYLTKKLGNYFPKITLCATSVRHIYETYPGPYKDQLRILEIFYCIFELFEIDPTMIKPVWPAVQAYLCLVCETELKGVQGYADYFT